MYLCILWRYLDKVKYKSLNKILLYNVVKLLTDRDGIVGVVIHNGLDGQGIEPRWGTRFNTLVQTGPGAHPASWVPGLFPWDKTAGA